MAEYEIERVCPVCGKHFDVLYKELWAYKKPRTKGGYDFYCTWKCLRKDEAIRKMKPKPEPEKRENKERLKVLIELMDAVKDGRNAYDYLKSMGYADPKDTLRRLRITAKEEAPKIYRKMEKMGLLDLRKGHSGKGVNKMSKHKLTREQKEKAVDIAIQGGDPLAYLKLCGAKNPTAAWWYIKKTLKETKPNKYLELIHALKHLEGKEPEKGQLAEVAEKLPPEAVAEVPEADPLAGFVPVSLGGPVAMSQEEHKKAHHGDEAAAFLEAANVFRTIMNPNGKENKFDGFQVAAVNGKFGQYRVGIDPSSKEAYFDFDGLDFDTQISMPQHDLAAFVEELTRAAQILGVDAG